MTDATLPPRFWSKTRIEDAGYETACLMWIGYVHPSGYGRRCAICIQDEREKRNARRRAERAAEIAARTHCGNGHVLADVGTFGPYRGCLECHRNAGRKRHHAAGTDGA